MDSAVSSAVIDPKRAAEVFEALQTTYAALPAKVVYRGTLNLTRAAINALAAVPHLRAASGRILAELPAAQADIADRLFEAALAAFHADLLRGGSEDALFADISVEAFALRDALVAVMVGLIGRKRVPDEYLEDVTPGTGYEDLAQDLGKLAIRFRKHWADLKGRVDVEPAEIDKAEEFSTTIVTRLAGRRSAALPDPTAEASVAEQQARAATLLRQTHDHARKVGTWLFWDDPEGVDAKVPSLASGRGRSAAAKAVPAVEPKEEPVKPASEADKPGEG